MTDETKPQKEKNGDFAKTITVSSIIPIVFVILTQLGLVGPAAQQKEIEAARLWANIDNRLGRLEEKLDDQSILTTQQIRELRDFTEQKTVNYFTLDDMAVWANQFKAENEGMKVPNPYTIRDRNWSH